MIRPKLTALFLMETSAPPSSSAASLLHKRNSSSLARKIALSHPQLDINALLGQGSGPQGKLMSTDILAALQPVATPLSKPTKASPSTTCDESLPKEKTLDLSLELLSFLLTQINKQTKNTQNLVFSLEDFLIKTLLKASVLCPSLQTPPQEATLTLWDTQSSPQKAITFENAQKSTLLSLAKTKASLQEEAPKAASAPLVYCSQNREELAPLISQFTPAPRLLITSWTEESALECPEKLTLRLYSPTGALPSTEFEAFAQELVTLLENPTLVLL